jgi:glycosyltransferase involved in cell wall biosynthesis
MPRRILLLITDLQIGGTPTVVRELAIRLARDEGAHIHVACLDRSGPVADQLQARGIAVTALNACCRMDVGIIFRLIKLIRRERIDTVFSFLVHANTAAAMASIAMPRVRYLQSIQTTQSSPRWHWVLGNIVHHAAEKVVVPSPSVAEAAQKWADVPPGKIVVIPNAVEIGEFSTARRSVAGKRVGFIGRLDPVKRVDDLIAAISLLPEDVALDIYGEGPERPQIESLIQRLNLDRRVKLHGSVDGPAAALSGIDLLVLPSDAEGFGLVLIEAMAAAVPVIGTNVPGIRDVISDGVSGILTPPQNPQALSENIAKILSDAALREKLVAGGKLSVQQRFSWPVIYPQYRALILGAS